MARLTIVVLLMLASSLLLIERPSFVLSANVRVSPAADLDPRYETSIAVNPADERNIVGVSKVILGGGIDGAGTSRVAYYYSFDGGLTWATGLLTLETRERTFGLASDPSVACDANGTFYVCALMLDNQSRASGVYIFKSTDGGRTFLSPVPAAFEDGLSSNP